MFIALDHHNIGHSQGESCNAATEQYLKCVRQVTLERNGLKFCN